MSAGNWVSAFCRIEREVTRPVAQFRQHISESYINLPEFGYHNLIEVVFTFFPCNISEKCTSGFLYRVWRQPYHSGPSAQGEGRDFMFEQLRVYVKRETLGISPGSVVRFRIDNAVEEFVISPVIRRSATAGYPQKSIFSRHWR